MSLKIETHLSRLPTWLSRSNPLGGSQTTAQPAPRKSIGDPPPLVARLENYPELIPIVSHYYGAVQKARRKLRRLSGKDAKILLAQNAIGAADDQGHVYLGVKFLQEYGQNDALLTAIMSHEWGHLIAEDHAQNVDHLALYAIHQKRQQAEGNADAFCGRMLAMLGYSPQPIIDFLQKAQSGNETLKYYAASVRGAIIQEAYRRQLARRDVSQKIFGPTIYANPYTSKLILEGD